MRLLVPRADPPRLVLPRVLVLRGVLGSVLVVAGGLLYARVPHRSWPTRLPVLGPLRAGPHHLHLGIALAGAGLGLLTWAWWDLRTQVHGRPDGVRLVRRCALAWAVPLLIGPPVFSGDGWSYVATGYLAGHGLSPYRWTPVVLPHPLRSGVNPVWWRTTSPYGPLPIAWGAALSHLTSSPWLLLAGYRLLALLAWGALAWSIPRLAVRLGRDPADAAALGLASPLVLAHGVGGLHNDLLVAAFATAALTVTTRQRWWLGAVLAGCAAAVKIPGGLAALGVVLLSLAPGAGLAHRFRRTAAVGAVATASLLGSGLVTGLGTGWVHALSVPDVVNTPVAVPAHLLARLVPSDHDLGPLLVVAAAALVLLVGRVGSEAGAVLLTGVVLLGIVVMGPSVHPWYVLWSVPLLVVVPLRRAGAAALTAGVVVLGLTAVAEPALGLGWLTWCSTWPVLLAAPVAWAVARVSEDGRLRPRPRGASR